MVDFCKHPAYSLNHHAGPHREPPSASSSNKARGFHLSPCVRTASLSSGPGRTPGPTPWDGTLARPPSPAGIRATGSPTPEEAPGPRTSSLSCGPRTSHPGPVLCAPQPRMQHSRFRPLGPIAVRGPLVNTNRRVNRRRGANRNLRGRPSARQLALHPAVEFEQTAVTGAGRLELGGRALQRHAAVLQEHRPVHRAHARQVMGHHH